MSQEESGPPAGESEVLEASQLYRLAWGFYLALGLAAILWIGLRDGTIPLSLFFRHEWWLDLLAGLGAGSALLLLWWGVARVVPLAKELEEHMSELLGSIDVSQAIGLAVMSGFAEELFFRGAVQASWGYLPATLVFAILHSGRERSFRLWTAFALASGLVLGGLVLWCGTLLAAIVAHMLVNGVNLSRIAKRSPSA
ncbi:MAG: CPBP family intramembrane glutamic endopeptidase [Acidobacteriota bacterium]|nr:CPBP family intramembrane glutamic endopeptidase [Acidobacteriota bacterium]